LSARTRVAVGLATLALAASSITGANADANAEQPTATSLPLAGKVVGIDPGHNGRNYTDPGYIDHLIWNGREHEDCDTTGTETDGGYTEAQFNFNVADGSPIATTWRA
jgi:N-acetylmuramoyl-L-alanine amidase